MRKIIWTETFRKILKRRSSEGGQTLLLGLIALIIIVMGILILFDLHTVIRGKVKAQTAVDSAAIVGANWQMHTLNLIGELNLIKACTVLLTDPLYGVNATNDDFVTAKRPEDYADETELRNDLKRIDEELARVNDASMLLTQMQTRISFVGPLIGYGAAQQAAKNNGLAYNEEAGEFHARMLDTIRDQAIYGRENVPVEINGYYWRGEPPAFVPNPYADMFENILDKQPDGSAKGISVGTTIDSLGMPHLKGSSPLLPYLQRKELYDWIHSKYWCGLKDVLRMSFGSKWWGEIELGDVDFIGESEILPIHIDFTSGAYPYNASAEMGLLDEMAKARGLEKITDHYNADSPYSYTKDENENIDEIRYNEDDRVELKFNLLPELTWAIYDTMWEKYDDEIKKDWSSNYLRGDFQQGMDYYSGALSYFAAAQKTKTISGSASSFQDGANKSSYSTLGEGLNSDASHSNEYTDAAKRASEAEKRMSNTYEMKVDATAKPIGRIRTEEGAVLPPFAAGKMVLPVFTKSTLIPVALEPPIGLSSVDYGWFLFVNEYLPVLGTVSSLDEMEALMNPDHWKKYLKYYHDALLKLNDPAFRQEGINWLDTPRYDTFDNYLGTNADTCDTWPGGGGGNRRGPGKLH